MLFALDIEIACGDSYSQGGGDQKDPFEQQGKSINPHHSVKAIDRENIPEIPPLHAERNSSEAHTNKSEVGNQLALAVGKNHFHYQRYAGADGQDQLRCDQLQIGYVE